MSFLNFCASVLLRNVSSIDIFFMQLAYHQNITCYSYEIVNLGTSGSGKSTVGKELKARDFDGKTGWYLMAVKLDLEVRNIIQKVPKKTPQTLTLV